jgi:hypothetical protein
MIELVACPKGIWIDEQYEKAMDAMERGVTSMKKALKH